MTQMAPETLAEVFEVPELPLEELAVDGQAPSDCEIQTWGQNRITRIEGWSGNTDLLVHTAQAMLTEVGATICAQTVSCDNCLLNKARFRSDVLRATSV